MNKAVPWNINGVGFDAREAAREAARRQGKSLGEWLHAVIADHAAEMGVAETEIAGQDRINAVTSRLERMSARSSDFDRRDRYDRDASRRDHGRSQDHDSSHQRRATAATTDDRVAPRRAPSRDEDAPFDARRPARHDRLDETEFLLDEAIETMNRRATRVERRTDSALASFAEMLEANEAKRDRERDAVSELSRKLSTIESKLTHRLDGADQNPIKGALARLEARLETIGRRGTAESDVKKSALSFGLDTGPQSAEPIRRLEDKLNSILDAVVVRAPAAQGSSVALAAADGKGQFPNRRLGDAIADIAARQRTLETKAGAAIAPRLSRAPVPASGIREDRDRASFSAMQQEITSLASKIEDMRREVVGKRDSRSNPDLQDLRAEIASMSRSLGELAPRGTVNALEDAIRGLTTRLEATRDGTSGGISPFAPQAIERAAGDLRHALADMAPQTTIDGLQTELGSIATKVDDLAAIGAHIPTLSVIQDQMHEIRDLIASAAARPSPIEDQVAALADRIDREIDGSGAAQALRAAADDVRAAIRPQAGRGTDKDGLEKIEARLESLTTKIDEAAREAHRASREAEASRRRFDVAQDELAARVIANLPTPTADVNSLSALVRDLGRKIEAVQSPGASDRALDALQDQIALLSERFGRSESGLASIGTLERSMQSLFAHLEETRATVETTAARAARDALQLALDEGHALDNGEAARHVASLRTMQNEAEARTTSTLNAVHETLEKVVDRLAAMEGDIADVRSRRADERQPSSLAAPVEAGTQARRPGPMARSTMSMTLNAAQPMLDPVQPAHSVSKSNQRPVIEKKTETDDDGNRADFIAAARRAAKIAQTDPSVTALKAPGNGSPARAGLIEKSRNYVATHKKPVLLGFAALFVILGTMAIMQKMVVQSNDMVAEHREPVPVARSYADGGDLTPSALPRAAPTYVPSAASKLASPDGPRAPSILSTEQAGRTAPLANPIPGSDPIPTGSISSLPAFAARGVTAQVPRTGVSNALRTLADAGDGPAEYELGARYAEGRSVPRDFKLAATWYGKAADQGLAPAQYRLASLYEKGLGVTQDKARAKSLYVKAAEAGNPRAMHNLAVMLADGDGHPDYDGAATWFKKAAQYGVHDSEYNLAILLARGLGTPQSLVQSYQWFAIAADQNDPDAAKKRDEVGLKLNANDLAVAKALAGAFRPRSAALAATDVEAPPGGWDGAATSSHLNSAGAKLSSL